MIETTTIEGNLVEVKVGGKLRHKDYERVVPELEKVIEREGHLRCLIDAPHIESIEPRALLDEIEFDVKHAKQITRCALVTESAWMTRMTELWGKLMPETEVKCFTPDHRLDAEAWVRN